MSLLTLREVAVDLGGRPALAGVTLGVERGEWLALIGPNGAGKSTLLRALAGLCRGRGAIELDGAPLRSVGRRALARRVALVDQSPTLPEGMTVSDYVALGRTPHIPYLGREGPQDRRAVADALAALELGPLARRRLETLSGGERQRAVLGRALAQSPEVLLLDEPTTALDLGRAQLVLELVAHLRKERGLTVVSATHDLTLAVVYADRLALLSGGRLAAEGPAAEVLTADRLLRHYGVHVRIVHDPAGGLAVMPARPGPAFGTAAGGSA